MMKRILLGAALLIAAFATAFEVEASTPALPVMRLDSTITKDRGEDPYEKIEYFYEDSAQPAYEKKFDWDEDTNSWENDLIKNYAYDASGNVLQRDSLWWNRSNEWEPLGKDEHTYDPVSGKLMQSEGFRWGKDAGIWEKNKKSVYTYNDPGNLEEAIEYYWDSDTEAWIENKKFVYTYNASGKPEQIISFGWDEDAGDWRRSSSKYEYTYPSDNTTEKEYFYRAFSDDWEKSSKTIYTYDAAGNMTEEEYLYWNSENWKKSSKYVYSYDNLNNETSYETFDWDSDSEDWEKGYSETYENFYSPVIIGVESANVEPSVVCYVSGDVLSVVPACNGTVAVYSIDGVQIAAANGIKDETTQIALKERGVYLVSGCGKTIKIGW